MFDMRYIGKVIAKARRAKNLTQMELADLLNISFQAVSNWERGISMPDISKLPELAELLGISIDEMLGKESAVIRDTLNDGDFAEVTLSEIAEAAPIMKPQQMEKLAPKMEEKINMEKKIDWSEIYAVIDYLSEDFVDELFGRALAEGEYMAVEELIEYASEDAVDKCMTEQYHENGIGAIERYLDFISEDITDRIAMEEYEKNGVSAIEKLADYLQEDTLNKIAMDAMKKGGVKAVQPIMDYIDCEEILEKFLREKYF